MAIMASYFPTTYYAVKRKFLDTHHFARFVVCRKCWKLYHFGECIITCGAIRSSKQCSFVQFPNHPYASGRDSCKHHLLKSVKFSSGKTIFYPFKIFCYKSLHSSLQNLLLHPGFAESCQTWKSHNRSDKIYDVYDAKIWKDFLQVSGHPFLSAPHCFDLMLNIDCMVPAI